MDRLYRLAEPQAGYFTTAQAQAVGVSRQELYYLRRRGDLRSVAYGIQRLARFPASAHEDLVVACLWAGEEAVVSHDSALVVYDVGDAMPAEIHVTTRERFRGRRKGVYVHHALLHPDEYTSRDGVPVTTPVRTIADLAVTNPSIARSALAEALERGLIRRGALDRASDAYPHAEAVFGAAS